jgi:inosine-uridine nucleoside N-ribohydrolase
MDRVSHLDRASTIAVSILTVIVQLFCSAGVVRAQLNQGTEPQRAAVILDTDIGDDMDDSWALSMLLRNPRFDLKLVTTTNGRQQYRGDLIAKFLTLAGRTEVPIGLGAGKQTGHGGQAPWLKGFDRKSYTGRIEAEGVKLLVETVKRSPGDITIIAIGPLQTLAAALKLDPTIAARAHLVGMQGSVFRGYGGSAKADAEYNVKTDAAAANAVLSAPWKSIMITPLDTCGLPQIHISGDHFSRLLHRDDDLVRGLLDSFAAWKSVKSRADLKESSTLYDAVAVYLADPAGHPDIKTQQLHIAVTIDGKTVVDPAGQLMNVATEWKDVAAFSKYVDSSLTTVK